jgi:hypothetical protein
MIDVNARFSGSFARRLSKRQPMILPVSVVATTYRLIGAGLVSYSRIPDMVMPSVIT